MSRKITFTREVEIEVMATVVPEYTPPRRGFDAPEPTDPAEVQDLYVGVIIAGTAIDITKLLNPKQLAALEEECEMAAYDEELAEDDVRFEADRERERSG